MAGYDQRGGMQQARGDGIPQAGEMIAGKYQVERVLGKGGMGVVVSAWHAALRQRVAVKFLLPSAVALPEAAGRFLREAQSAVAITSEHVARVLDVGTLESGSPYIIMEYLTGADMSQLLRARGPLPIQEAVDYILQASEAIAEAHSLGIVHRDLKPANLFLASRADGSPLVKVLDFGLSKVSLSAGSGVAEASLTATSAIVGSPHYMSPEQMRSLKNVDARTDIWSLGVILYMLLTGRRPFDGESMPAIFGAIAADQPPSIRSLRPEVPAGLEDAVFHCLEKDLSRRAQTVAEMARALRPFGSESASVSVQRISRVLGEGATQPTRSVSADSAPINRDSTTTAAVWGQTKASTRSHVVVAVAAGVAALIIVVLTGVVLTSRKQASTDSKGETVASPGAEIALASAAPLAPAIPLAQDTAAAPSATNTGEVTVTPAPPPASASALTTLPAATPSSKPSSKPAVKPAVKPAGKPSGNSKLDRWD